MRGFDLWSSEACAPTPAKAFTVPLRAPPDVPWCTMSTTPEEWAARHRKVTGDVATIYPWGAVCRCGALWSRDPAKGGDLRNRPDPEETCR